MKTVHVPTENIDTDQIIPARFLKGTTREGLGEHAFADWKERPEGEVLLAGANFGCGSSREHAVWALMDRGFKAVVSTRIADIFRNNALKNGLLAIEVAEDSFRAFCRKDTLEIDLESQTIEGVTFEIDPFARYRLLRGIDEMDYLLDQDEAITEYKHDRNPAR